jgi:hypothetical protein
LKQLVISVEVRENLNNVRREARRYFSIIMRENLKDQLIRMQRKEKQRRLFTCTEDKMTLNGVTKLGVTL